MRDKNCVKCDPGYCLYAANTILPLLAGLDAETEGVKTSCDIEYIHRCRVATRRIRAALTLYEECFPPDNFKRWKNEIRYVTGALGEARDKDVQIEFLESYIKNLNKNIQENEVSIFAPEEKRNLQENSGNTTVIVSAGPGIDIAGKNLTVFQRISFFIFKFFRIDRPEKSLKQNDYSGLFSFNNPDLPGLRCLKLRLEQERHELQPDVIKEIEKLENAKTVEKFGDFLQKMVVKGKIKNVDIHSQYAFENAFYHISLKMEEIFWYEKFISDPDDKKQHHAMRIAAKRLRYTLEAFSELYDGALKESIKSVKKLQDILGDIHDCDVWADFLVKFLEDERRRSIQYFGNQNFFRMIIPGIENLHDERVEKRKALHFELMEYWEELKAKKEWELIRKTISLPIQSSFHHLVDSGETGELKIALIGDIHANLPALEAVLSDANERGAAAIINTGDFVGYGAFPDNVISLLRKEHVISVIGNYDLSVLSQGKKSNNKKPKSRSKRIAMKWAYDNLSGDNRLYLKSLPKFIRLNLRDKKIYITHGSPLSVNDYITEDTAQSKLKEYLKAADSDIIITGHSHLPFAKEVDKKWFINTGSVGRPEDGDPRACYALLSLDPLSIYHIRVPYDIEKAEEGIYKNNLPEVFARIYREGKPLDIIKYAGDEQTL